LIRSVVGWWFKLVVTLTLSAFLGVVVFIRTGISAGMMTETAYAYAGVVGLLVLVGLVWLRAKVDSAPEVIEGFLRRLGLYKTA
jgi:archaellum biogenesis protein FlaJ (TadC family)